MAAMTLARLTSLLQLDKVGLQKKFSWRTLDHNPVSNVSRYINKCMCPNYRAASSFATSDAFVLQEACDINWQVPKLCQDYMVPAWCLPAQC